MNIFKAYFTTVHKHIFDLHGSNAKCVFCGEVVDSTRKNISALKYDFAHCKESSVPATFKEKHDGKYRCRDRRGGDSYFIDLN